MKSIITNTILLVFVVILVLYLFQNSYFSPYTQIGDVNLYNVSVAGILLAVFIYSFTYLVSFLGKKKIAYGKGEFPSRGASIIHGLTVVFITIFSLVLHIFHVISFGWAITVCIIVLVIVKLFFN